MLLTGPLEILPAYRSLTGTGFKCAMPNTTKNSASAPPLAGDRPVGHFPDSGSKLQIGEASALCAFKSDEPGRLRALARLDVLDTAAQEPFESIVKLVRQVLDVPICAISLVDAHRQWFKAQRGLAVTETARDIAFCNHTIQSEAAFTISDATLDMRFSANPLVTGDPNIRSYLGVPLTLADGFNVGSLCAIDTEPRAFSAAEIEMLANFGGLVVGELELRQKASTDALTGAMSRAAWFDIAQGEVVRAVRYGRPLSFLIVDIDHFKAINDTFGHSQGDIVLRQVAKMAQAQLRRSDHFGRFGGEEFTCALPETSFADAHMLAERIRKAIKKMRPKGLAGQGCTVSIGVTSLAPGELVIGPAFERADRCLYQAKRAGRDRVVGAEALAKLAQTRLVA